IDETQRRRTKQLAYNEAHGITARTIKKAIRRGIEQELQAHKTARTAVGRKTDAQGYDRDELIRLLTEEMIQAADRLAFEEAAELRDQIKALKAKPANGLAGSSGPEEVDSPTPKPGMAGKRRRKRAAF
ncbi:MAG: UvrB/UvrC motif-containing protein, partial [Planctomycetes bacterium]|nr:UvrB/UvrC motif-containing protein [Planctomycetota bacterium]